MMSVTMNKCMEYSCLSLKSLIIAIEQLVSPFMEDSPDILVLGTKDIVPEPVITGMSTENQSKTV